MLEKKCYFSTI